MRDHLLDIVKNTYGLGIIDLVKVSGTDSETTIEALAEDRSVIVQAKLNGPVAEFIGTFGMPNLGKLNTILGIPEYKDNAKISITKQERNGEQVAVGLHFENASKSLHLPSVQYVMNQLLDQNQHKLSFVH